MSNQHNEREDQAEELRRLVYDVEHDKDEEREQEQMAGSEMETRDIDILNLPPRKEVHGNHQKRTRLKTSTSFKRFLLVIFALIIVLAGIYYFFGDELIQIFSSSYTII